MVYVVIRALRTKSLPSPDTPFLRIRTSPSPVSSHSAKPLDLSPSPVVDASQKHPLVDIYERYIALISNFISDSMSDLLESERYHVLYHLHIGYTNKMTDEAPAMLFDTKLCDDALEDVLDEFFYLLSERAQIADIINTFKQTRNRMITKIQQALREHSNHVFVVPWYQNDLKKNNLSQFVKVLNMDTVVDYDNLKAMYSPHAGIFDTSTQQYIYPPHIVAVKKEIGVKAVHDFLKYKRMFHIAAYRLARQLVSTREIKEDAREQASIESSSYLIFNSDMNNYRALELPKQADESLKYLYCKYNRLMPDADEEIDIQSNLKLFFTIEDTNDNLIGGIMSINTTYNKKIVVTPAMSLDKAIYHRMIVFN